MRHRYQVDNYFKRTANKLAKTGNIRVYVPTGPDSGLIGFYAANAHAVHYAELPDPFKRDRPGHGIIPAAYISMIGVDSKYQGQGFGGDLLVDCLRRIASAAAEIGIRVVLLEVPDCGNPARIEQRKRLYASCGFAPLPSNGVRLYLPMSDVDALVAEFS